MNETQREWLESTLSLSKNGGIYYGGAREYADERTAVLFVGLGGSGADVLLRIKDQVKSRMILPSDETGAPVADQPKNIGFLEIDTDNSVQKVAYGTAHFEQFGKEFCDISVKSTPVVSSGIKKAKSAGEKCWQWLDDDVNPVVGSKGAGGIRQIGRMLLMNNIAKVINSVSEKINLLTQNTPNIERLLIYVCSGISGGTGSGILLDMAYIVREVAHAKIPNTITMGYVLMPDVDELRSNVGEPYRTAWRANGYACLKELDYYTRTGEAYCQSFPNGYELNRVAIPFDYVHLINSRDDAGHILSYEKILMSVAESIIMHIICRHDTYGPDILRAYEVSAYYSYPYKMYNGYFSLGVSETKMPCREINTLYIARVFENLDISVFKNRPTENQFNVSVFKELEVSEECIRSALYKSVTVPRPLLEVKNYKYADVWPNNAPYQAVHNWLTVFQRSVVPQAANLPVYLEGKLKEFIKRNLKDKKTGPFYLRYFLKSQSTYCLDHMLEGFRRYHLELQQQCVYKSNELRNDIQQAFAEGANAGFFNRKKALERYLKSVERWYRNEECAFLNEKLAEILGSIQSRVKLYYEKILQPLTDILWQASKICAENIQYLQSVSEKNWIIQPLEFEKNQEKKFHELAEKDADDFTEYLYENLRKWIGRDIDNVDEDSKTAIDIEESLRNFIYRGLYYELGHEDIERNIYMMKLYKKMSPKDYMVNLFQDLLKEVSLMYRDNFQNHDYDRGFVMLYVPANEPMLYRTAKEFLKKKNLDCRGVWCAKSNMTDRISIIKGRAMSSLASNAFLPDMKRAYEVIKSLSHSAGIDVHPECRDILFEDDIANSIDEE